jgi:hypothetical protein
MKIKDDIFKEVIKEALWDWLPHYSEFLDAVAYGVKEAMLEHLEKNKQGE